MEDYNICSLETKMKIYSSTVVTTIPTTAKHGHEQSKMRKDRMNLIKDVWGRLCEQIGEGKLLMRKLESKQAGQ